MILKKILILGFIISLAGCGPHHFSIDKSPATSLSLDASERLLLVTDEGGPDIDKKGNTIAKRKVICAEPSPDVFTTLALGAKLKADIPEIGSPEGSGSFAQNAAALGLRTQTIQLLRDGLYRVCEAYLNGIIDEGDYNQIIKAYDEVMITTLAIEGLTQQVPPELPKIGMEASTGESTTSSSSANVQPVANTPSDLATINLEVAKQVRQIVRDYYCFQISMKQIFYSPSKNNFGEVSPEIINHLCSDKTLTP